MSNDKTLATAKHGGCVLLSSPSAQDALDCIGRIEEAIEFRVPHDIYAAVHGELAELKAALAARQPVEESVEEDVYCAVADMIEPYVQREGINPEGVLPASVHDSVAILLDHWVKTRQSVAIEVPQGAIINGAAFADRLELAYQFECPAGPLVNCTDYVEFRRCFDYLAQWASNLPPLYAAPPAQAVDLGRWSQRHADDLHVAVHTALSVHAGSLSQKKRAAISAHVKRALIDSHADGRHG